ncbi:hypothetical protein AAHZ94_19485 [Streptomyces sp. HSW2009]|uniref:hypothetical protein n=1 Tax=Streptomyces sp. HSW2009 TaxID=3142890 RepID=UPI0032F03A3C
MNPQAAGASSVARSVALPVVAGPGHGPGRRAAGGQRARAVTLGAFGLVAALLVAGCGIRGTSVPVDAGGAPSRASCDTQASSAPARPRTDVAVTVQLLCAARLEPVPRALQLPKGDENPRPAEFAKALLGQLQRQPSQPEREAGFSTAVPSSVQVAAAAAGDPAGALRLTQEPADLPPEALAQVVCTFAQTAAVRGARTVVLGGPAAARGEAATDRGRLMRYECGTDLRDHPASAQSSGTLLAE